MSAMEENIVTYFYHIMRVCMCLCVTKRHEQHGIVKFSGEMKIKENKSV